MNFQQLRSVRETVRQGFNLTEVAEALFTSQPGVSRQIRELEDELGTIIFERYGKRLTGLTEPGVEIVRIIERLLLEQENLRRAGSEYAGREVGRLTIATTHTQARYALPPVIKTFRGLFPEVRLHLHQSAPRDIAQAVLAGEAEIGIATEALDSYPDLVTFPGYQWNHVVVVPPEHPLLGVGRLSLASIARYPIITYDAAFTGRPHIDDAFRRAQVEPEIVVTAMDADVIKRYAADGLGIGIIASVAFEAERDPDLRCIDVRQLFPTNMTRVAIRRGAYLRGYAYTFIESFAPHLTRSLIEKTVATTGSEYVI